MASVTISDGQTPTPADVAMVAADLDDDRLDQLLEFAQELRSEMTS